MHTTRHATVLAIILMAVVGCYHATIDTGATPSPIVIREAFASSWVFGLVPPKTVETARRCQSGVATVETRLSFLNQLVGFLTLGIFTPMEIVVTCAAPGSASHSGTSGAPVMHVDSPDPAAWQGALATAIERSLHEGRPISLRLD